MICLMDGNILSALVIDTHVHHSDAHAWFALHRGKFATCSITQGTLLRVHMTMAADKSAQAAWETLAAIVHHPRHLFWDNGFSYTMVPHKHLQGPRQVTDAWLAELARRRKGKLVTFDSALAVLHPDVAVLLSHA